MSPAERAVHDVLIKALVDKGKLIEAGFLAMRVQIIPADASPGQVSDMRIAYMGGAQHLFASLMAALDPDKDPTPNDMRRMALIDAELRAIEGELKLRAARVGGSA
jgi:hypothetical protein